MSYTNKP